MRALARRLARLEATGSAPAGTGWERPFDPARLTAAELAELGVLAGEAAGGRTAGLGDFGGLDDARFDRLATLVFRGHGRDWASP